MLKYKCSCRDLASRCQGLWLGHIACGKKKMLHAACSYMPNLPLPEHCHYVASVFVASVFGEDVHYGFDKSIAQSF